MYIYIYIFKFICMYGCILNIDIFKKCVLHLKRVHHQFPLKDWHCPLGRTWVSPTPMLNCTLVQRPGSLLRRSKFVGPNWALVQGKTWIKRYNCTILVNIAKTNIEMNIKTNMTETDFKIRSNMFTVIMNAYSRYTLHRWPLMRMWIIIQH